jgi:hypothetical protein
VASLSFSLKQTQFSEMACIVSVILFGSVAVAVGTGSGSHLRRGTQFGKMNPEAVAHTMSKVEAKWMTQAVAFEECNSTDAACQQDTTDQFEKSCQTIVRSLLQGSDGDKSNVAEYMGDVCEQQELHGWKKSMCNNFAIALNQALTDDNLVNRDDLPADKICGNFLTKGFLKDAAKGEIERAAQEKQQALAAEEEAERKEAEEKAAEEAAEAKKREAAAKAEAARKAADLSAKMREEAKAKADEAKQKAAEAADIQANSSTLLPAANVTVNASSDVPVANSSTSQILPEQNMAVANDTSIPSVQNSTVQNANFSSETK